MGDKTDYNIINHKYHDQYHKLKCLYGTDRVSKAFLLVRVHSLSFHVSCNIKGIVHLPQGHPRCRCLCFRSSFNFDIFRSNRSCLSYNEGLWSPPQKACSEKSKL